jgi:hypothetical protein
LIIIRGFLGNLVRCDAVPLIKMVSPYGDIKVYLFLQIRRLSLDVKLPPELRVLIYLDMLKIRLFNLLIV